MMQEKITSSSTNKNGKGNVTIEESKIIDLASSKQVYADTLEGIVSLLPLNWQGNFDYARDDMCRSNRILLKSGTLLLEQDRTSLAWRVAASSTIAKIGDLSRVSRYCHTLLLHACHQKSTIPVAATETISSQREVRFATGLMRGLRKYELFFDNEQLADNPEARRYLEHFIIQHNNTVASRNEKIIQFTQIEKIPIAAVYVLISAYAYELGKLQGQSPKVD